MGMCSNRISFSKNPCLKKLVPRPGFEPGSADFPALSRGLSHVKVRNDWPNYTIEALFVLSVFLSFLFNIFRYWLFEL